MSKPLEDSVSKSLEELRAALQRRAERMLGGRYFGSGAPQSTDLVQQVFSEMTANGSLEYLSARSALDLRRYAFRALHHRFLNHCVRKRRESRSLDDASATADPAPSPAERVLSKEEDCQRQTFLRRALGTMSEEEQAFVLACVQTGSAPAAQRETGFPPGGTSNACERRRSLFARLRQAAEEYA